MLKRIGEELNTDGAKTTFAKAQFPAPFREGLEYSSPARGMWNIVHTGMLIPESHQIFVCAQGCLRGVVLTAAEMGALGRYSAIQIREKNVLLGGMEKLMIDGVTDIVEKLPYRPRAILLFISCQHFFLAYDQKPVLKMLRERFPDIKFVDCYMIPTLRKSGVSPNQKMQIQMYRMWEPELHTSGNDAVPKTAESDFLGKLRPRTMDGDVLKESCPRKLENGTKRETSSAKPKKVNLIGSNLLTDRESELVKMVESAGYEFWDLHRCKTFDDYLAMAEAELNLVYEPIALPAARDLKRRLDMDYLYLTFSYDFDELEENYRQLAARLGMEKPDFSDLKAKALAALASARELIGDTPVALDYTFTFRTLSFARLLLEHGFHVTEVFADAFLPEDEENFKWIRGRFPEIVISATNRPKMRFLHPHDGKEENRDGISNNIEKTKETILCAGENNDGFFVKTNVNLHDTRDYENKDEMQCGIYEKMRQEKTLAIGQKAAYFCGTDYFVNVAESGGYYGFQGIIRIAELMKDAFLHKKDRKSLIQKKGFGCESCL